MDLMEVRMRQQPHHWGTDFIPERKIECPGLPPVSRPAGWKKSRSRNGRHNVVKGLEMISPTSASRLENDQKSWLAKLPWSYADAVKKSFKKQSIQPVTKDEDTVDVSSESSEQENISREIVEINNEHKTNGEGSDGDSPLNPNAHEFVPVATSSEKDEMTTSVTMSTTDEDISEQLEDIDFKQKLLGGVESVDADVNEGDQSQEQTEINGNIHSENGKVYHSDEMDVSNEDEETKLLQTDQTVVPNKTEETLVYTEQNKANLQRTCNPFEPLPSKNERDESDTVDQIGYLSPKLNLDESDILLNAPPGNEEYKAVKDEVTFFNNELNFEELVKNKAKFSETHFGNSDVDFDGSYPLNSYSEQKDTQSECKKVEIGGISEQHELTIENVLLENSMDSDKLNDNYGDIVENKENENVGKIELVDGEIDKIDENSETLQSKDEHKFGTLAEEDESSSNLDSVKKTDFSENLDDDHNTSHELDENELENENKKTTKSAENDVDDHKINLNENFFSKEEDKEPDDQTQDHSDESENNFSKIEIVNGGEEVEEVVNVDYSKDSRPTEDENVTDLEDEDKENIEQGRITSDPEVVENSSDFTKPEDNTFDPEVKTTSQDVMTASVYESQDNDSSFEMITVNQLGLEAEQDGQKLKIHNEECSSEKEFKINDDISKIDNGADDQYQLFEEDKNNSLDEDSQTFEKVSVNAESSANDDQLTPSEEISHEYITESYAAQTNEEPNSAQNTFVENSFENKASQETEQNQSENESENELFKQTEEDSNNELKEISSNVLDEPLMDKVISIEESSENESSHLVEEDVITEELPIDEVVYSQLEDEELDKPSSGLIEESCIVQEIITDTESQVEKSPNEKDHVVEDDQYQLEEQQPSQMASGICEINEKEEYVIVKQEPVETPEETESHLVEDVTCKKLPIDEFYQPTENESNETTSNICETVIKEESSAHSEIRYKNQESQILDDSTVEKLLDNESHQHLPIEEQSNEVVSDNCEIKEEEEYPAEGQINEVTSDVYETMNIPESLETDEQLKNTTSDMYETKEMEDPCAKEEQLKEFMPESCKSKQVDELHAGIDQLNEITPDICEAKEIEKLHSEGQLNNVDSDVFDTNNVEEEPPIVEARSNELIYDACEAKEIEEHSQGVTSNICGIKEMEETYTIEEQSNELTPGINETKEEESYTIEEKLNQITPDICETNEREYPTTEDTGESYENKDSHLVEDVSFERPPITEDDQYQQVGQGIEESSNICETQENESSEVEQNTTAYFTNEKESQLDDIPDEKSPVYEDDKSHPVKEDLNKFTSDSCVTQENEEFDIIMEIAAKEPSESNESEHVKEIDLGNTPDSDQFAKEAVNELQTTELSQAQEIEEQVLFSKEVSSEKEVNDSVLNETETSEVQLKQDIAEEKTQSEVNDALLTETSVEKSMNEVNEALLTEIIEEKTINEVNESLLTEIIEEKTMNEVNESLLTETSEEKTVSDVIGALLTETNEEKTLSEANKALLTETTVEKTCESFLKENNLVEVGSDNLENQIIERHQKNVEVKQSELREEISIQELSPVNYSQQSSDILAVSNYTEANDIEADLILEGILKEELEQSTLELKPQEVSEELSAQSESTFNLGLAATALSAAAVTSVAVGVAVAADAKSTPQEAVIAEAGDTKEILNDVNKDESSSVGAAKTEEIVKSVALESVKTPAKDTTVTVKDSSVKQLSSSTTAKPKTLSIGKSPKPNTASSRTPSKPSTPTAGKSPLTARSPMVKTPTGVARSLTKTTTTASKSAAPPAKHPSSGAAKTAIGATKPATSAAKPTTSSAKPATGAAKPAVGAVKLTASSTAKPATTIGSKPAAKPAGAKAATKPSATASAKPAAAVGTKAAVSTQSKLATAKLPAKTGSVSKPATSNSPKPTAATKATPTKLGVAAAKSPATGKPTTVTKPAASPAKVPAANTTKPPVSTNSGTPTAKTTMSSAKPTSAKASPAAAKVAPVAAKSPAGASKSPAPKATAANKVATLATKPSVKSTSATPKTPESTKKLGAVSSTASKSLATKPATPKAGTPVKAPASKIGTDSPLNKAKAASTKAPSSPAKKGPTPIKKPSATADKNVKNAVKPVAKDKELPLKNGPENGIKEDEEAVTSTTGDLPVENGSLVENGSPIEEFPQQITV